jgi:hypothetical protein
MALLAAEASGTSGTTRGGTEIPQPTRPENISNAPQAYIRPEHVMLETPKDV